jgi:hypothetical protein
LRDVAVFAMKLPPERIAAHYAASVAALESQPLK